MKSEGFRVKSVWRWSQSEQLLRLWRFMWERGKGPGGGWPGNYDTKLSIGINVRLENLWIGVRTQTEHNAIILWVGIIPGIQVRFHYKRSYGGHFV